MKPIKLSLIILAAALNASCSPPAEIDTNLPRETILSARVLSFADLSPELQEKATSRNEPTYIGVENDRYINVPFSLAESYFIEATIDVYALATLTEANKCGTLMAARRCSEEELEERVESRVLMKDTFDGKPNIQQAPYWLYGKYKNRWVARQNDRDIPSTAKFAGFYFTAIERDWNEHLDDVVIGPIPQCPEELIISINSGNPSDPDIGIQDPRFILDSQICDR